MCVLVWCIFVDEMIVDFVECEICFVECVFYGVGCCMCCKCCVFVGYFCECVNFVV